MTIELQAVRALKRGRELVEDPKNWGFCFYRQDLPNGSVKYCTLGAIYYGVAAVEKDDFHDVNILAIKAYREANDIPAIAQWNDQRGRTHQHVLDGFDAAIELAKEWACQEMPV